MRINKFVALATGMSRRAADAVIAEQRVRINQEFAMLGAEVHEDDQVTLDGRAIILPVKSVTIMLNKPVGYVCSRNGQGSQTIYDLLPAEYHNLKPVGRLDKHSSGLLLLTNDGELANELTHPKFKKTKVYEIEIDHPLTATDKAKIENGVILEDGISSLQLTADSKQQRTVNRKLSTVNYRVAIAEGRNRQIRRTFEALGYKVVKLHRTQFGPYALKTLPSGATQTV